MVIVEQRDYHVTRASCPSSCALYEEEGIAIQQEVLGGFVGAFTTEIGALSTYTSMWRYDSFAQREERRAALQARDDWKAFLGEDPAAHPHAAEPDPDADVVLADPVGERDGSARRQGRDRHGRRPGDRQRDRARARRRGRAHRRRRPARAPRTPPRRSRTASA